MIVVFLLMMTQGVEASEFRRIRPIPAPSKKGPEVIKPLKKFIPLNREVVENAMKKIVNFWSRNDLQKVLGKEFYDRERLQDAMNSKVPRDARLDILSIQGIQTLGQEIVKGEKGEMVVSTVSVTARTEVLYNDPQKGLQRLEGTNEYIIRIKEKKGE
jgi:hypothetical protein